MKRVLILTSALIVAATCDAVDVQSDSEETVDLQVIQSYTSHDGGATSRAYLVDWKNQEVVVIDPRATTKVRSDRILSVLVIKVWNRGRDGPLGRLSFLVSPAKYRGAIPPVVDEGGAGSKYVEIKVTKVVYAEDGPFVFKCYIGNIDGQDVAISDLRGTSDYAVGAIVKVRVGTVLFTSEGEQHESMMYYISDPPLPKKGPTRR